MTLTREEILSKEPGEDLDALIGKEVLGIAPAVQWWAMDGEEEGIFITFHYESEANEWMVDQERRFPGWNEKNGTHIVRKEIFRNYSGSISAAWEVEEQIASLEKEGHYVNALCDVVGTPRDGTRTLAMDDWRMLHATPEQRCKAALLAVLNL